MNTARILSFLLDAVCHARLACERTRRMVAAAIAKLEMLMLMARLA
ncbi:MAG: hypothetical protein ACRD9W_05165 [Terriglobia bacterium]